MIEVHLSLLHQIGNHKTGRSVDPIYAVNQALSKEASYVGKEQLLGNESNTLVNVWMDIRILVILDRHMFMISYLLFGIKWETFLGN